MACTNWRRSATSVRATRFERSTEPGTRLKGAGLGLTLARHAARAQGGDLVRVDRPQGSRFVLRLPYLPGRERLDDLAL